MKIALVTGAGRGIGAATALRLAKDGWDVAVYFQSNVGAAEAVVDSCKSEGVRAIAVQADVSDESQVSAMFQRVDEELGPLTALVNNAGVTTLISRLEDVPVATIDHVLAINVKGPFLCAQEAVRRMSTNHGASGGVIVNVSSIAARVGGPNEYVLYAASKGAIDTLTLGLSKEAADEGIRVNTVRPGVIRTEIHASSGDPDRAERMGAVIPMKRAGEAEEVANSVAWLCSDEASYVTAQ